VSARRAANLAEDFQYRRPLAHRGLCQINERRFFPEPRGERGRKFNLHFAARPPTPPSLFILLFCVCMKMEFAELFLIKKFQRGRIKHEKSKAHQA
jgi:hypothetical protein